MNYYVFCRVQSIAALLDGQRIRDQVPDIALILVGSLLTAVWVKNQTARNSWASTGIQEGFMQPLRSW